MIGKQAVAAPGVGLQELAPRRSPQRTVLGYGAVRFPGRTIQQMKYEGQRWKEFIAFGQVLLNEWVVLPLVLTVKAAQPLYENALGLVVETECRKTVGIIGRRRAPAHGVELV